MLQSTQLSLAVQLPDDETFASFYPGSNAQLITMLKNAAIGEGVPLIYFWGCQGSGRYISKKRMSMVSAGKDASLLQANFNSVI